MTTVNPKPRRKDQNREQDQQQQQQQQDQQQQRKQRPGTGRRVSTQEPGIYRYVSPRGPEFDTFYAKVGKNEWLSACRTLDDAKRLRAESQGIPRDRQRMTAREFVELYWMAHFAQERGLVSTTVRNYLSDIKPFVKEFGQQRLIDIGREEIKAWGRERELPALQSRPHDAQRRSELRAAGREPAEQPPQAAPARPSGQGAPWSRGDPCDGGCRPRCARPVRRRVPRVHPVRDQHPDAPRRAVRSQVGRHRLRTRSHHDPREPPPRRERGRPQDPQAGRHPATRPGPGGAWRGARRLGSPFVFHNPSGDQLTASSQYYYWNKLRTYHAGRHGSHYAGLDFYEATKHCGATWMRNELCLDREQLRIMLGHTNYDYVDLYSHPDDVVMAQNVLAAVRHALDTPRTRSGETRRLTEPSSRAMRRLRGGRPT